MNEEVKCHVTEVFAHRHGAEHAHDEAMHDDHGKGEHGEHEEAGHDEHENEEAGHSSFHAKYQYECSEIDELTSIDLPYFGAFENAQELEWDDLILAGVPYGEIIGEGEIDLENDIWKPGYDQNSHQLVDEFNGQLMRLPAFIVPLEYSGDGVISFLAVPIYGACIHTPPPPPNQIVYVTLDEARAFKEPYQPYWILGNIEANLIETELAFTGYSMKAQDLRVYEIELPEME